MAYQASFFRDGQWVTETVDLATALKGSSSSTKQPEPVIEHPACGILSSTVVDSPIVHKILPVRLRSRHHNDIALIGEHVVTIRELRDNGQTHEVLKYRNLGSRIRNAVVLGTCPDDDALDEGASPGGIDRVGGDLEATCHPSIASSSSHAYPPIPPQILVLILGTGDMVFLFIRDVNGAPEFCINKHATSTEVPYLGCHFAVDPTSRFMAAAAFEEILTVYELEPRATLNERYMTTGSLGNPFKSIRYRSLRGTVYDVQFLYPRPQDDYHIILMVILSSKGRDPNQQATRRYILWDWAAGDDLGDVLNKAGHRQALAKSAGVPLFTIPLKSQSAFFIVYPRQIALVKQPMSVADYDSSFLDGPEPSDLFHGKDAPLWTAWARPFRLKQYYEKTDVIYLAREDGFMFHIEIDSSTLLFSRMELGSVGTNIGTAFTTAYDRFSDVFIIGGDSAPGGIWKLAPRSELERVSTFANWSPVVDSTVIIDNSPCGVAESAVQNGTEPRPQMKRDRIFFASGRGASGCLVELRVGLKARIGAAVDVEQPIKQAWLFANRRLDDGSMYAILAHPHWTTILAFSAGFADVQDETTETSPFDTTSRTLHAIQTSTGMIVQASENSVSLIAATQSSRHSFKDLIKVDDIVADNAFCSDDSIVISAQHADETQLHILRIEEMGITLNNSWTIAGEISCISQLQFFGKTYVAVGSAVDAVDGPQLSVYSTDGRLVTSQRLESAPDGSAILEALTSICVVREADDIVEFMAGTRCGRLLTICISDDSHDSISWRAERLGTASVKVFPSLGLFNKGASALATCDDGLIWLSGLDVGGEMPGRRDIIWPTDVSDPALPAPPVHSAFMVGPTTEGAGGEDLLLLVSGTNLLVVDVESRAGPVPRSLPLGCTVTRMMFSNIWRCLVVAVQEEKGVGLRLIDPDTGIQISKQLDGEKKEGYLTSFGHAGDKILGIHEWKYVKDNQTFPFIIVTMLSGKLVIVSVSHIRQPDTASPRRRLEHWTRYRKKGLDGPVYSVVADEEGIIYCAGKTLHREVLDLAERKLKPVKTHDLESPATTLEIVDGKLFALTTSHSVQVLDYKNNPGSRDMAVLHSDRVSRATVHMTTVQHTKGQDGWAVTLLSDLAGGVTGVYVPEGQGNKDLGAIFRADLTNPVRRFIRTHSRSIRMAKEGRVPRFVSASSTKDGLEVLGVSVDGTLRQFKVLGIEIWRYLDLVQRLARNSRVTAAAGIGGSRTTDGGDGDVNIGDDIVGSEELDPEAEPKNMYIDGDILGFCLEQRLLERVVDEGDGAALFCRCLDRLEGAVYTSGFAGSGATGKTLQSKYFELGYEILEEILAPVV